MHLRIASDLHIEFMEWARSRLGVSPFDICLPQHKLDKESTLILAGDISGSSNKRSSLDVNQEEFLILSKRFKYVIIIDGNHEFYGRKLNKLAEQQKEATSLFSNIFHLQNEVLELDGKRFLGATLWTNIPTHYYEKVKMMSDYRYITINDNGMYRKIRPRDTISEHLDTVRFFQSEIKTGDVVITHHAPSFKSTHEKYKDNAINYGYMTNLENLIHETKPGIWIHGHVHNSFDYMVEQTRIIANPRGYQGIIEYSKNLLENSIYEPFKFLEI